MVEGLIAVIESLGATFLRLIPISILLGVFALRLRGVYFAIATLVRVAGMVRGAGEAIFAVARTAGWIAHALEAYSGPGPLRPRAVYTGRPAADQASKPPCSTLILG